MSDKDDVFVLNQPFAGLERRTSKSGKERFTVRMVSEPIAIDTNERRLLGPVVLAVAHHLRERVKGITELAAFRTQKARQTEARAYAEGKSWATRRYTGGRTGATPPDPNEARAFNASGRFANGIAVGVDSKGTYRVNVPANRLTNKDSGGVARIMARLLALVPEFLDMGKLMAENTIVGAMEKSIRGMIVKGKATDRAASVLDLARGVFQLGRNLAGIAGGD
jgi:hypothetical protein